MFTARCWWLMIVTGLMLSIGLYSSYSILLFLGLAIVAWIIVTGIRFLVRVRWTVRHLRVRRRIRDDRGVVTSLWASQSFKVDVLLFLDTLPALPYVYWGDMVPFGVRVSEGSAEAEGALDRDAPLRVEYRIDAAVAGRVRFEGCRVEIADLAGLFYWKTFVRTEQELRVLPPLLRVDTNTASHKRINTLPPPGINRLPRPGSGSELLDLRDYLPGDPPKTIAWKISARRDKLITKEYESEVPVRCTIFLDTSNSVRLGIPGETPLSRLVEIASSAAQANMSIRDLTGLCLFDEHKVTTLLRPARTRRQLIQMLNVLADAAALAPAGMTATAEPLLAVAYTFAQEVYPDYLRSDVNRVPWWLWAAAPTPGPWVRKPGSTSSLWRGFVYVFGTLSYLPLIYFGLSFTASLYDMIPKAWFAEEEELFIPPLEWIWFAQLLWFAIFYPIYIGFLRDSIPLLFNVQRRRQMRQRKQLAAMMAVRYDLGPGGLELLFQDDERLGVYLQRFLVEHRVPFVPVLQDENGKYLFRSTSKLDVLANALLRSVARGHDNELFVLCVDLLDLDTDLGPLLRAVKVALGRHHHVMVVVPWPPGMELPPANMSDRPPLAPPRSGMRPSAYVARHLTQRHQEGYHRIRRIFARLQVPVVCAGNDESPRLILERMDRLRGVRRRR